MVGLDKGVDCRWGMETELYLSIRDETGADIKCVDCQETLTLEAAHRILLP
jgi:hypothetical protein